MNAAKFSPECLPSKPLLTVARVSRKDLPSEHPTGVGRCFQVSLQYGHISKDCAGTYPAGTTFSWSNGKV